MSILFFSILLVTLNSLCREGKQSQILHLLHFFSNNPTVKRKFSKWSWERARATVLSPFAHLKKLIKLVLKGGNFFLKNLIFISYLYWKKKEILIFNLEYLEGKFRRVIRDETFKCVPFFSFSFFTCLVSSHRERWEGTEVNAIIWPIDTISSHYTHTHTHVKFTKEREYTSGNLDTPHREHIICFLFFLFLNFLLFY